MIVVSTVPLPRLQCELYSSAVSSLYITPSLLWGHRFESNHQKINLIIQRSSCNSWPDTVVVEHLKHVLTRGTKGDTLLWRDSLTWSERHTSVTWSANTLVAPNITPTLIMTCEGPDHPPPSEVTNWWANYILIDGDTGQTWDEGTYKRRWHRISGL